MDASPPPVGPRIALARDFEDFRGWDAFRIPEASITDGHSSSPERWVYIDRPAPPLGEEFPVGTILVKASEVGTPSAWEIHAMVKRGDGYNPEHGGWEFFDLALDADERLAIAWRGTGDERAAYLDPTTGERRACNTCHGLVPERDFVFYRELYAGE